MNFRHGFVQYHTMPWGLVLGIGCTGFVYILSFAQGAFLVVCLRRC